MSPYWQTFILSVTLTVFVAASEAQTRPKPPFVIAAYLPDYILPSFDASRVRYLTDVIYFSIEPKPDGTLDTTRCEAKTRERLKEIRKEFKGRMLIALGGWERSAGFAPMAKEA